MMKKLFTILSLLTVTQFWSQPNPDLFQTWYLTEFQDSDLGTHYQIANFDPPISPILTIFEDFTFDGYAACNPFSGTFDIINDQEIYTGSMDFATDDCGIQQQNWFELDYFAFMETGGTYTIEDDGTGLTFIISTPIFGFAVYTNYPLSNDTFNDQQVVMYPNPFENQINLLTNQSISKIEIYNSQGRQIQTSSQSTEIDTSDLQSGLYIFHVIFDNGDFGYYKMVRK